MNKDIKKVISRVFTGVFFWGIFVVYAMFKGLEINHLETLVLAELSALVAPLFIKYVAESFK